MSSILHLEFQVTVVAVRQWGLDVMLPDGTPGSIDNTKDPAWTSGDRAAVVGAVVRAVVIDDERSPVRLSALDEDADIARVKRDSV